MLSRRVLLEKQREELKEETLKNLEEGVILKGMVKNITDYGAFIDLGGIDGLLHITDMSWGRINHPSRDLQGRRRGRGRPQVRPDAERVCLGIKQILPDPWHRADEKYPVGTRVKGKVVSLTDYGAFVELEQGVEGLVHVSEMSWTKRVKHPRKMVKVGEEVEAVVLDIDPKAKRIALGMKQIEPNPWAIVEEKYPVGSVIKGKVRNVTDFGIFVGVEEGIDGLVHVSDLSWTQRIKHPCELFKKGDEVEAVRARHRRGERALLPRHQAAPAGSVGDAVRAHPGGSRVKGKVTKVTDFGVFVEIEPGVEGLVHVSELKRGARREPARRPERGRGGRGEDHRHQHRGPEDRAVDEGALNEGGDDYREYLRKRREVQGAPRRRHGQVQEVRA